MQYNSGVASLLRKSKTNRLPSTDQARFNRISIDFVFTHKEVLTVLASDGGYQLSSTITKLFKEALNLRKEVAKVLEQKLPLNITINANINVGSGTLIANTGNGNIQIGDSNILWAAQVTKHSADRLVGGIDGNQIEFVELSGAGSEMKITEEDRVILGQNREELTAEISVIGRLDMVAFSSHKGTIIAENERFPLRGKNI
ncbi:hypothetical protein [Candidatus Reidiella endopervernicosa]|uniref:Uncharacterized protein n=1 Tax=Candidatus Reidiella endopervernicosa TaxID=2738883 RepID=A0A6N0HU89_9GAMM|nr:hypothetical protein [Candidatus Reidiella endopervernicosa]QKQ25767.1 hypothetical protein HUE57_05315 [Candidatus Reidiella endopervernicosa]